MGLFANVPYAQARRHGPQRVLHLHRVLRPRLQLAADHVHGVPVRPDHILITVTKIRKMIILAIPGPCNTPSAAASAVRGLRGHAERRPDQVPLPAIRRPPPSGAVAATPGLGQLQRQVLWVFLIGLVLAIVFTVMKVKGGMLLAIAITTVIGIPFGVTTWSNSQSISETSPSCRIPSARSSPPRASRHCSLIRPSCRWSS